MYSKTLPEDVNSWYLILRLTDMLAPIATGANPSYSSLSENLPDAGSTSRAAETC